MDATDAVGAWDHGEFEKIRHGAVEDRMHVGEDICAEDTHDDAAWDGGGDGNGGEGEWGGGGFED